MKAFRKAAAALSLLLGAAWFAAPPAGGRDEAATVKTPAARVAVLRADVLDGLKTERPMTATLLEVTLAPGAGSPPHRHPGSVSGYVAEGTFEFAVGDGPVKTLGAGDTFFEPTMVLHRVGRNPAADAKTRLIVTMVHPSDAKRLVIPEPVDD